MFREKGGVPIQYHNIWAVCGLHTFVWSVLLLCPDCDLVDYDILKVGTKFSEEQPASIFKGYERIEMSCDNLVLFSEWQPCNSWHLFVYPWDLCRVHAKWMRPFQLGSSGGHRSYDDHDDVNRTDFIIGKYYVKAET
jgi:hypothetical protein